MNFQIVSMSFRFSYFANGDRQVLTPNECAQLTVETAKTFEVLRQQMRDRFPSLSPHLQRIARASLEEPNRFALNTTPVIAAFLDIQPSTLIRFAKEFGFAGFSDLQKIFRQRLIEGEAAVREQVLANADTPRDDVKQFFEESITSNRRALEQLAEGCDLEKLAQATDLLRNARHVYVAGLRRSRPIADYLVYGLVRGERPCGLLDFAGGMDSPQIATFRPDDLLVAIAFPPYSKPVLDAVMDAHVAGRRIVTITDSEQSPLARFSEVSLLVPSDSTSRMQPIVGAIALVHTLITAVTQN